MAAIPARGCHVCVSILTTLSLIARAQAASENLTIAGVCADQDQKPVAGATVRLFWLYVSSQSAEKTKLLGQVTTTENGVFRFSDVDALVVGHENDWSEYFLVVTHLHYASALI
ncbi:MAG: hypothetical protein ACREHD_27625, partial [Pirellulales bacterium]